jgi:hypothetical protein
VQLADREFGLSGRTIARRLSLVSGLYVYLVASGDTPVRVNLVPRGLLPARAGRNDVQPRATREAWSRRRFMASGSLAPYPLVAAAGEADGRPPSGACWVIRDRVISKSGVLEIRLVQPAAGP